MTFQALSRRQKEWADARKRVWKGFRVIRELREIETVNRENRWKTAVIREFHISCKALFTEVVISESWLNYKILWTSDNRDSPSFKI